MPTILSSQVSLLIAALESHLSNMRDTQTIVSRLKGKAKDREMDSRDMALQGKHASLAWRANTIAAEVVAALPNTIMPPFPQKPFKNEAQLETFIAALKTAEGKLL